MGGEWPAEMGWWMGCRIRMWDVWDVDVDMDGMRCAALGTYTSNLVIQYYCFLSILAQ